MSDIQDLLAADEARRTAMIARDVDALCKYLDAGLRWTHSSGRTDNRQAVLDSIAGESVRYLALAVEDADIMVEGNVFIYRGIVRGHVEKDGAERDLANKFLSVWRRSDSGFEMLAWQSTAI